MLQRIARAALLGTAALAASAFGASAATAPKHVILIMMENHGTDTIFGNKEDAPFLNQLITQNGVTYATQYYGVTHPSLPNYLALVSGDFQGIHDDCKAGADVKCPPEEFAVETEEPPMAGQMLTDAQMKQQLSATHMFKGKTLIDQLDEAKRSWKIYMQGMPVDQKMAEYGPIGADGKVATKLYAQKHNPFLYFASFHDNAKRVASLAAYDEFTADLAAGKLADFTWISPDQCHDMHGVSESGAKAINNMDCAYPKSGLDHSVIKLGDAYVSETIAAIKASPVWKDDTAILLVWDEDDYAGAAGIKGSPVGRNGVSLGGSRAPLIVVTSKDRAPRKLDVPFNHYSLLATLEAAYGVPCLRQACEMKDAMIPGLFN